MTSMLPDSWAFMVGTRTKTAATTARRNPTNTQAYTRKNRRSTSGCRVQVPDTADRADGIHPAGRLAELLPDAGHHQIHRAIEVVVLDTPQQLVQDFAIEHLARV